MSDIEPDEPELSITSQRLQAVDARLVEAGSGRPVLAFGPGFAGSAAHRALARRFRVVAFETAEPDAKRTAEAAAAWLRDQRLDAVGLIGVTHGAAAALWCASELGDAANALVLVSPRDLPLGPEPSSDPLRPLLKGMVTPKALLVGTDDPGLAPTATELKRSFSKANVVLVFGAGRELYTERPDAFADVAGDFLDRQARFRFATDSVAVQS